MLFLGLEKVGGWQALIEKVPEAMHVAKPYDDPVYPFWGILATAFYAGIFTIDYKATTFEFCSPKFSIDNFIVSPAFKNC